MNPDRDRRDKDPVDDNSPPASPYGPQPHGADEAAGGADSSPYENESTDERKAAAEAAREKGRGPNSDPDPGANATA